MTTLQAAPAISPSRQRVLDALAHKQPDQVPVDFGSTSVTGIHVSCVAALRDHFGLEKRPVKVHEPFQMLGLLDEDLKQVLGIDVEGVFRRRDDVRLREQGLEDRGISTVLKCLSPGMFNTTVGENGDILIYPAGRPVGRAERADAQGISLLRRDHPPDITFDDDHLNVEDNVEEFQPLDESDLADDQGRCGRRAREPAGP